MKFIAPLYLICFSLLNSSVESTCVKVSVQTIEMCLDRLQIAVDKCAPSDQACLCKEKYFTLECYNTCLEDKEYQGKRANRESEVLAHCRAANINTKEFLPTATTTSSGATDKPKETGNSDKDTSKSKVPDNSGSSVYHYSSVAALSALTYSVLYL